MKNATLICLLAATYGLAFGQQPTLQELEKQEIAIEAMRQNDQTSRNIAEISSLITKIGEDFQLACTKAFGLRSFCQCIGGGIPAIFTFADYVKITTGSKAVNNYVALDKETQRAYDKVAPVRDRCVAKLNSK